MRSKNHARIGVRPPRRTAALRGPALLGLALLGLALLGCPKQGGTGTSGTQAADTWVVFDIVEKGSGNPIPTLVWVEGHEDDFETVMGGGDGETRFEGFGKTGEGYVVPFSPNQKVRFQAWSQGHELIVIDAKLKRGENVIALQLRKTEVEDERVPKKIRLEADKYRPGHDVNTGT